MIPTTKDGKHEIVFPEDFWHNHGFDLRAALEGRVTWELLRIGEEEPDRAKNICDSYNFTFRGSANFPLDDPNNVLVDITMPYTGKIVGDTTRKYHERPYPEGDSFLLSSLKPITMHPTYPSTNKLQPLQPDSDNLFGTRMFDGSYFTCVPELEEMEEWFQSVRPNLASEHERVDSFEGSIIDVSNDIQTSAYLKNRSLYLVLYSLAQSRNWGPSGRPLQSFSNMAYNEKVYASLNLQRKLASASEALCLEYLSEMRE